MNRTLKATILSFAIITAAAGSLFAAPIDDAKALLAQKKYEEVDKALGELLTGQSPNPEALKISFDAAMADGRVITASKRIDTLLDITEGKDPALLLQGAELAENLSDSRKALVRYVAYARLENNRTPSLEKALIYVLSKGPYADEYKKYLQIFGPTDRGWDMGQQLLERLIEIPDAPKAREIAELIMTTYPQGERVYRIHQMLRQAADNFLLGKEPRERFYQTLMVMVKGVPSNYADIDHILRNADPEMNYQERVDFVLEAMSRSKQPVSLEIINRFRNAGVLETDDAKLKAGRAYLALEPVYRDSKNPADYGTYLGIMGEMPQVFAIEGKALLSPADVSAKISALLAKTPNNFVPASGQIENFCSRYFANPEKLALIQAQIPVLPIRWLDFLLTETKGQNIDAVLAANYKDKTFKYIIDQNTNLMPTFNRLERKDLLIAAARNYIAAYPGTFSEVHVRSNVMGSALFSVDEKISFLDEMANKLGGCPQLVTMAAAMAGDKANFGDNPKFQAVKQKIDAKTPSNDPLVRADAAINAVNQGDINAAHAVAKKFLSEYAGRIPGDLDDAKSCEELAAYDVLAKHWNFCYPNPDATVVFAETWAPRLSNGEVWTWLLRRVREFQKFDTLLKITPNYFAAVGTGQGKPDALSELTNLRNPEGNTDFILAPYYDKMGDYALRNLYYQRGLYNEKRQLFVNEVAKILTRPGYVMKDMWLLPQLMNDLNAWASPDVKIPPEVIAALWNSYIAWSNETGSYDPGIEHGIYALYKKAQLPQQAEAHWNGYLVFLQKRPVADRISALNMFIRYGTLDVEEEGKQIPQMRVHTILKVMRPLYDSVLPESSPKISLTWNLPGELKNMISKWQPGPNRDEAIALAATLSKISLDRYLYDGPWGPYYEMLDLLCKEAVARKDWPEVLRLTDSLAKVMAIQGGWEYWFSYAIKPMLTLLEENGAYQLAFAFAADLEKEGNPAEAIAKQIAMAKAKLANHIPNLIPVAATDPTYNLHLAAHYLSLGDQGKAWELTLSKLDLLPTAWQSLDADYVAWAADQMRRQKLLNQALQFVRGILLQESDLDPETAAQLLVIRGDIYRDMENYQAARLEYEGLRQNNRYQATQAGLVATYRLIGLMILTKDYNTAEGLLERLIDSNSPQTQAEAYYLYAKMAFEQGEYRQAKEYVQKVRDRVSDHVEAALLEGELNLYLPGGLQYTEVAVGDPRLSTVVMPGRQLTLKLRDPNLSVARGGMAIPVVITTSNGGDVEHIKLLPSSADKNLFLGNISTTLGKPAKDNLVLEVNGDDVVSYIIDPEFQKANDLSYPPKTLQIRSDARLAASSGKILTEEEEKARELELKMQKVVEIGSRRFDIQRSGQTVRPGSDIYVQVTDLDRDVSDEPDTVTVDIRTTSGDRLGGFPLKETGPHTGMFRGTVPTGIPLPKASASDTEAGKNPGTAINSTAPATWSSAADGKKPKWFEVDTMSSFEIAGFAAKIPHLSTVQAMSLWGMLSDDYEKLAVWPETNVSATGGLTIDIANEARGSSVDQIRRHLKVATTSSYQQDSLKYDRADTPMKGKDGWTTNRITGTFYLPGKQSLELQFTQPVSPNNWQTAYLFIDGQLIIGGTINADTIKQTGKITLEKGCHKMEILLTDYWQNSTVSVGYRMDDGTIAPLPEDWFSTVKNPELADFLRTKGKVEIKDDMLNVTFAKPIRLRKLKLVFEDFTETAVSIDSITVKDVAGKTILPVPNDFSTATTNNVLEIAPGDEIEFVYTDPKTLQQNNQIRTTKLNSSYFNGNVSIAYEFITQVDGIMNFNYYPARRCRTGDQLVIMVTDYDEDTTDQRDVVDVLVTTSSGEKLRLQALETAKGLSAAYENHAGQFMAILKTGDQTGKDTIKVVPGDRLIVSYVDRENTNPGIPIERTTSIEGASNAKPELTVYRTSVERTEKKSLSVKEGEESIDFDTLIVATHPDYKAEGAENAATQADASGVIPISANAPLLLEVKYPTMALHQGSKFYVEAVADSELAAAKKEQREPEILQAELSVENVAGLASRKGYPVRLQSHIRRDDNQMLQDGCFAGVIRFQLGSPGDPVNDLVIPETSLGTLERTRSAEELYDKVPTLLVAGNDTVHIRLVDAEGKQVSESRVRLVSDAMMEIADDAYRVRRNAIHIGEKFFIRIDDPDQDTSDLRDSVVVELKASSGDTARLVLSETLDHSGIFTGSIQPVYKNEKPTTNPDEAVKDEDQLRVDFGDEVTLSYVDAMSLASAGSRDIVKTAKIYLGSDGNLTVFTKRFPDSETAVKTRLLMAEAFFELAKGHRKLGQTEEAAQKIARGKEILEEALRDYPETTLMAHSEYLLANLAQELGNYQEAIGRYSQVIQNYGESEYAPISQFKKALCFEKMDNYDQACEEYVKLTYIYPNSPLVADATLRLANYYYTKKSYEVAGKVFLKFQQNNPHHEKAPKALFLSAQCACKNQDYTLAVKTFQMLIDEYPDEKDLRAEAMYWKGDTLVLAHDNMGAYRAFKKLTWDYPETKWAKIARGRLTEDVFINIAENEAEEASR